MDPADVRRLCLSVGFDHVSACQSNTAEWLFPAARACLSEQKQSSTQAVSCLVSWRLLLKRGSVRLPFSVVTDTNLRFASFGTMTDVAVGLCRKFAHNELSFNPLTLLDFVLSFFSISSVKAISV